MRTADGRVLVGPDNGLLSLAWERCGGVDLAVDVTRSPHRLEPVSATFHGRDIFAPVAAHLARGAELADAGDQLDPAELQTVELPQPRVEDGTLVGHALVVDRFGNAALNVDHDDMAGTGITLGNVVEIEAGGERYLATYAQTFADVRPGRADRLRGRLPHARGGDQPRRRRRHAGAAAGRRGASAAAMIGTPRVHLRLDRLDQRARPRARRGRGAARHAGHGRRAAGRPGAAGPGLDGAAALGGADVGACCAS